MVRPLLLANLLYSATHPFLPLLTPDCCCSLTGQVGVKLLNGRVAYSAAELSSDAKTDKLPVSNSVSAPHDRQPVLCSGNLPLPQPGSQFHSTLSTHTPAARKTSLRPTPPGLLQAHSSFQAYTADTHVSKARNAASSLPQPQPAVQQALDIDLNDDDAFDAICDLDALLTPPSLHQPAPLSSHGLGSSTQQHRRHCSSPTRLLSERAHTSTAHRGSPQHGQYSQTQTYSPKKANVRAQVHSPKKAGGRCSAVARSSGRCLWTGDQQTATEAASVTAPMRILKRPVIPDQQASCSAVSPPLAATPSVPTAFMSRASAAHAGSQATPYSTVARLDSPVSATSGNESPPSLSDLNYSQNQQSMQGSAAQQTVHSNYGSISKAPSVAPASSSAEAVSANFDAAHCTGLSASQLNTALAFPPGLQPRGANVRHHSKPMHQLAMELPKQALPTEAAGLEPDSQVGTVSILAVHLGPQCLL